MASVSNTGAKDKPKIATMIVELVAKAGVKFFHDDDRAYAVVHKAGVRRVYPVRSQKFRSYAAHLYYKASKGEAAGAQQITDALTTLESQAIFEGPAHVAHLRIAEYDGEIHLDLANEAWQVVTISKDGWKRTANAPVYFRRPRGMWPLPTPARGGRLDDLKQFISFKEEDEWRLFLIWLLFALLPRSGSPCSYSLAARAPASPNVPASYDGSSIPTS